MIVNHAQDKNQIHTRFDADTKLTEIAFVPAGSLIPPEPFRLDYHQVDKLAETLDQMTLAINEAMDAEIEAGLRAMGIEPTGEEPELLGYQPGNFIAEAVTEYWGRRCPDFEPLCACCQAWKQYDAVMTPLVVIEKGHDPSTSMTSDEKREVAARYGMALGEMQGLIDQFNPDKTKE